MSNTTTTTTVDETTTTTTVDEAVETTTAPVEKQGEVEINKDADAHVLREQSHDERLENAKQEALANHAAEHADDKEGSTTPASNDKE